MPSILDVLNSTARRRRQAEQVERSAAAAVPVRALGDLRDASDRPKIARAAEARVAATQARGAEAQARILAALEALPRDGNGKADDATLLATLKPLAEAFHAAALPTQLGTVRAAALAGLGSSRNGALHFQLFGVEAALDVAAMTIRVYDLASVVWSSWSAQPIIRRPGLRQGL